MRLVVISNRLPVELRQRADGRVVVGPGSGGLVTALRPVLKARGGVWIGWPGGEPLDPKMVRSLTDAAGFDEGFELVPVMLPREEQRGFYQGFANEAIWPLFHDMPSHASFDAPSWAAAKMAVRRFSEVAAVHTRAEDLVWVHDYHLFGAAAALREAGVRARLVFFLHIPFPAVDLFRKLPWRAEVLSEMLDYDVLGFQTPGDRRNFVQCLQTLIPDAHITSRGSFLVVRHGRREARVGVFPIGIDFREFADAARADRVTRKVAALRSDERGRKLVLGVDRLDYTKGLTHRLQAVARLLETEPELRGTFTFVQFVVPSRQGLPRYDELKREAERMVGEINGRFTRSGWVPIRYNFRAISRDKLLAYYRAADVGLVTPLKDGMNLVAKEYVAAHVEADGVLVLSEFAGASTQLEPGALLVNPWDIDGTAAAIATALRMPVEERRARMRRMRRSVRKNDVHRWVGRILDVACGSGTDAPRNVVDTEADLEPDDAVFAH